ncbi:hypothetical protein [Desulfatitalea alkaliphila]|uniref:Uncharacterized protein n=1 Tax=Desulfatitalea alkaliphila TaxID=2929485 RepID=A0AA41UJL2_9BACT|nr:hypothetical protein [Desulfatitalea alkaliphila]MCJ8501269.1 hypothetical protein [Desulfatitalea alkaliphila]
MTDRPDDKDPLEEGGEQFKMRIDANGDDVEETPVASEINELRLEKISQRVTLISIIIPVLIVVVLVIAYLDMKKRVVQTEDSGAIEFRKLSSDLESRFSSLSLRQAQLEEDLAQLTASNDHAMAGIQVRFEKMHDALNELRGIALDQKRLDAVRASLEKEIQAVAATVAAADKTAKENNALMKELQTQVVQQGETLSTTAPRMAELEKQLKAMDERKLDKQGLDLPLRLEALKIETNLKAEINALQKRLEALEGRLSQTPTRTPAPAPPAPSPAPRSAQDEELETQVIE